MSADWITPSWITPRTFLVMCLNELVKKDIYGSPSSADLGKIVYTGSTSAVPFLFSCSHEVALKSMNFPVGCRLKRPVRWILAHTGALLEMSLATSQPQQF